MVLAALCPEHHPAAARQSENAGCAGCALARAAHRWTTSRRSGRRRRRSLRSRRRRRSAPSARRRAQCGAAVAVYRETLQLHSLSASAVLAAPDAPSQARESACIGAPSGPRWERRHRQSRPGRTRPARGRAGRSRSAARHAFNSRRYCALSARFAARLPACCKMKMTGGSLAAGMCPVAAAAVQPFPFPYGV
jgi:hypothetical protein